MYRAHSIAVVVPAYNEEGFVGDVIETVPEFVDRVYVVDDRSTDGTWDEVRRHAELGNESAPDEAAVVTDGGLGFDRRIVPIRHAENTGVGGAIKTGYLRSLGDDLDVTAVMAGDGQMDPDYLDRLLDPIVEGEADYAKGNRLLYRDYRQEMSNWRLFGNSLLTFLTKMASGYWKMMDPQNGYTAVSNQTLEHLRVEEFYDQYGFLNDLLVRLNVNNSRIADVPIPARYGDERSSIKYQNFIPRTAWLLLRRFLWRLRLKHLVLDFNPLALFYFVGAVALSIGTAGGTWAVYKKIVAGQPLFTPVSLSLTIFMIGSLFFLFAMLLDMEANADKEIRAYE